MHCGALEPGRFLIEPQPGANQKTRCNERVGPAYSPNWVKPRNGTDNFPEESYLAVSQMLQQENEIQPLSSAIHALGHLDDPAAIPLILSYQQHPEAEIRFAIACALGSFANNPKAIPALMILTSDADDDVRDWAVFGLGNLGDADSAEIRDAIFARLNDPNEDVREEAMVGLAKRKDQRVLLALIAALNQSALDDQE